MTVTTAEREAFQQDGAVLLKQRFGSEWIKTLRAGIDRDLASPTDNFARHTKDPDAPAYLEDFWAWSKIPEFEDFVRGSPCAELAAGLLGADQINLVMDNWFLREAGSTSRPLLIWSRPTGPSPRHSVPAPCARWLCTSR